MAENINIVIVKNFFIVTSILCSDFVMHAPLHNPLVSYLV